MRSSLRRPTSTCAFARSVICSVFYSVVAMSNDAFFGAKAKSALETRQAWVTKTVYFLARHFQCFSGLLGAPASRVGARCVQRCDDRPTLGANNVRRVVIILIVRFHHVKDHRLRLIAGWAAEGRAQCADANLKEAILLAGEDVGNEIADEAKQERKGLVSYLQWAAIKHPPAYLQLLARVMSTQIETSTKHSEPYKTVEELQKGFRSVASRLPSACSRSRDSLIVLAANLNLRVAPAQFGSLGFAAKGSRSRPRSAAPRRHFSTG